MALGSGILAPRNSLDDSECVLYSVKNTIYRPRRKKGRTVAVEFGLHTADYVTVGSFLDGKKFTAGVLRFQELECPTC